MSREFKYYELGIKLGWSFRGRHYWWSNAGDSEINASSALWLDKSEFSLYPARRFGNSLLHGWDFTRITSKRKKYQEHLNEIKDLLEIDQNNHRDESVCLLNGI